MEFTDGHQDSPPIPIPAYFSVRGVLDRVMEKERMRQEMEIVKAKLLMEQYALCSGLSLHRSSQHLMDFVVSPHPMIHFGAIAEETALGGNMPLLLNRELQGESWGMDPVSCPAPQKIILESKAVEENKTATKRKAPSPPPQADEEIDVPLVEIVKKTEENRFYCKVCRVSSNSERSLQNHLGGRKHKSKEAALSAKKEAAEENLRFPFWCRECKVGAHTEDVMLRHELGKKHVNRPGRPESKFSVLVNELAEWVDAYGKESISDELVDKAEPEELEGV